MEKPDQNARWEIYKFRMPTSHKSEKAASQFNGEEILEKLSRKKFVTIQLDGDEDFKKIEVIRYKVRELKYTNDTGTVLRITWGNEFTFSQLIELIHMMQEEKQKRFMLFKDAFYVIFSDWIEQKQQLISEPIYLTL
jgi:hypothetical protein